MQYSQAATRKHGKGKREKKGDYAKPREHVYILWGTV